MARNLTRIAGWMAALVCLSVCKPVYLSAQENPYIQPQVNVRQLPVNQGATALWETLQKLHTRASLLMIVAHPDDEDSGMLTYESRGQGVRVGMLTLNRGEGGQNVMTGDFNDALGLIRTQELLKEDEYSGIDQMFGSVVDFGFSKTMDETLANWGYDRVLCDAVRTVRIYRPMVITSVFIGGVTDGHGHHQVAGRLAQEVFNAAGDPSVCADQIKEGLQPWQPLKVYERVPGYSISDKGIYDYATGKYAPAKFYNYITKIWSSETPSTDVTIPEGTYSPLLGMSYLQFARVGLGQQLSQYGGSSFPVAGAVDVAYHRYGSRVSEKDKEENFFDGIDTSLAGIASLAPVSAEVRNSLAAADADVTKAMAQYSVADTAKIAPLLADGLKEVNAAEERIINSSLSDIQKADVEHELLLKQAQFNDAIIKALGLSMRAQVDNATTPKGSEPVFHENADTALAFTPGEKLQVNIRVNNPSGITLECFDIEMHEAFRANTKNKWNIDHNDCYTVENLPIIPPERFEVLIPEDAQPTQPYFTRPNIEQTYYDIADLNMRNQPAAQYPLTVWAMTYYNGVPITLGEAVQTAHHINGQGTVYQPLVIVPAISVALAPSAGVIPLDAKTLTLTARVHSDAPNSSDGSVHLDLPAGWSAEPASASFHFTRRGEETAVEFTVTPKNLAARQYTIRAVAESGNKTYTDGYTTVGYPGLTPTNMYRSATYKTSGVDVHMAPGLRVAYLPGTGDDVPQSLTALGVNVHTLTTSEIAAASLSQYDEIILGVRAYNAHPELAQMQPRLNAYMEHGGVVITQYNTAPFASTAEHPIAPYPFTLSSAENVVQENAPVSLLLPEHPLLTWPNKITPQDFDNWAEERGHSFLRTWDPHYDALTETHDDGQDPQRGGLVYTRSGCGAYVYVAYALYRQLPEGVPGAYRLFANLLSLPKNVQAVGGAGCTQPPAH